VLGASAMGEREPHRLGNQVRPEAVRLWPAEDSTPVADAASAATPPASSPAAPASATTAVAASVAAPTPTEPTLAAPPAPAPAATPASAPALAASALASVVPTASSAAVAGASCLEAGPFAPADLQASMASLAARLPAGSWTQRQVPGGEWMIYMGPYPDGDFVNRKKAELARIRGGVRHDEVSGAPLPGLGLSLGRFGSQAAAEAALAQLRLRGIRTARVLRSGDGPPQVFLRLPKADAATAATATSIRLQPAARAFTACP
jgi:hypothetical protein